MSKNDIWIGAGLVACFVFLASMQTGVDGTSGATMQSSKELILPKESKDYDVYVSKGLENYTVGYDLNFFRGGTIQSVEGAQVLKDYNIRTIISITPDDKERSIAKEFGFNLVELPFEFETVPKDILDRFVALVTTKKGPFYAHCHGGSHRAGILGMVYRVVNDGWSIPQAEKEFVALGGYPVKDRKILDAAIKYLKSL